MDNRLRELERKAQAGDSEAAKALYMGPGGDLRGVMRTVCLTKGCDNGECTVGATYNAPLNGCNKVRRDYPEIVDVGCGFCNFTGKCPKCDGEGSFLWEPLSRVELLAFCDEKLAVTAVAQGRVKSGADLETWAAGLQVWPKEVLLHAAVAAYMAVFGVVTDHEGCEGAHDYGDCEPIGKALEAATKWLMEPTRANERLAVDARAQDSGECFAWLFDGWADQTHWPLLVIRDAANMLTPEIVKGVIQTWLVTFALGKFPRRVL